MKKPVDSGFKWINDDGTPTQYFFELIQNLSANGLTKAVSTTEPTSAQAVVYNATTGQYEPGSASAALSYYTSSLSADVALNNVANYFDGPTVAQGSVGTWYVVANVVCVDTAAACNFYAKLWDGTTVISSSTGVSAAANFRLPIALAGIITSPAGNLRVSVRDPDTATGKIEFNRTGNSKDSTITAIRIA